MLKTFLASGPLVLLLLVNALMGPQHTNAATSSSEGCNMKSHYCLSDPECLDCILLSSSSTDAYFDCKHTYSDTSIGFGSDGANCDALQSWACCLDAVSSDDCLGNSFFAEYHLCFLQQSQELFGCPITNLECSYDGGVDDGAADDAVIIDDAEERSGVTTSSAPTCFGRLDLLEGIMIMCTVVSCLLLPFSAHE